MKEIIMTLKYTVVVYSAFNLKFTRCWPHSGKTDV